MNASQQRKFTWEAADLVVVPPKKPPAVKFNPHHDQGGRFAPSDAGGVTFKLTKVEGGQPFDGKPVPQFVAVSKQETGRVAEEVAKAYLQQVEGRTGVQSANVKYNNFPVDVVHDYQVVEVKGGRIDNGKAAQQWRLTIGQPGKAETAALKLMSDEEKRAWNERKAAAILGRKDKAMRDMSERLGGPVRARTITAVVDHDKKQAHVYSFEGFHQRIGWTSEQAKRAYVGTFGYGEVK